RRWSRRRDPAIGKARDGDQGSALTGPGLDAEDRDGGRAGGAVGLSRVVLESRPCRVEQTDVHAEVGCGVEWIGVPDPGKLEVERANRRLRPRDELAQLECATRTIAQAHELRLPTRLLALADGGENLLDELRARRARGECLPE